MKPLSVSFGATSSENFKINRFMSKSKDIHSFHLLIKQAQLVECTLDRLAGEAAVGQWWLPVLQLICNGK